MLPDYDDIIEVATVARRGVAWWDKHGVPRFTAFKPDMQGVYDHVAVLAEITCQACGKLMHVGMSTSMHERMDLVTSWKAWPEHAPPETERDAILNAFPPPPTVDGVGFWHYGDPPRHDCVGDTMNSEPRRILEYWTRDDGDWRRRPEYELEIRESWVTQHETPPEQT